jgi:hypothetical protein
MEKGDKPKPKPKDKKVKKAPKQTQKQTQKQSVKIVIGETKSKPKRKYVRKPKAPTRPSANIVRGQTVVSYLGAEGDLNQVITGASGRTQPAQQAPAPQPRGGNPPPQPPVLSQTQAPTTLDTELSAVSELMYPKARTPAFEEKKKKVAVKKKKPVYIKIGEGIGDFIKQNLLDKPADFNAQEPNSPVEMPRPALTIKPERQPIKPGKAKPEQIYMEIEEKEVIPTKRIRPIKGTKTDVPIQIFTPEKKSKGGKTIIRPEDIPSLPEPARTKYEKEQEKFVRSEVGGLLNSMIGTIEAKAPEANTQEATAPVANTQDTPIIKVRKPRKKKKPVLIIEEEEEAAPPTEVVSLQDPAIERLRERISRDIVEETVNDMIATIETPIFSENPDFRTISQNVEVDNVPSGELDFGDEGLTQFNIDGFVPVGRTEGLAEVVEKKKAGRPKKYEDPEVAKQMKREQTLESNRRLAEKRKAEREQMKAEQTLQTQIQVQQEYDDFVSLEQQTDALRTLVEAKVKQREEEEASPYSLSNQFPNMPDIQVAQEYNPLGEYAGAVTLYGIERPSTLLKRITEKKNREAYDSDFISGDFNQQIGDLFSSNNFSSLKPMLGETDAGYDEETPVPTTALFSKDPVNSDLPFLGIEDIQFI